jgi:hypothetical protein
MKVRHIAGAGLLSLSALSASAATVTFEGYASTQNNTRALGELSVIVDDNTTGFLTFTLDARNRPGRLSNVYIEAGNIAIKASDILKENFSVRSFRQGARLAGRFASGLRNPAFDFGFGVRNASSGPLTFQISTDLLTLENLQGVGLRFQGGQTARTLIGSAGAITGPATGLPVFQTGGQTGSNGQPAGEFQTPAPVPLPASAWLLLGALGGLGGLSWRRKQRLAA